MTLALALGLPLPSARLLRAPRQLSGRAPHLSAFIAIGMCHIPPWEKPPSATFLSTQGG